MATQEATHLTPQDYQHALLSQSACNASGLIYSLAKVLDKIWAEARQEGTGGVNHHPILRLYIEQLSHLVGTDAASYSRAYSICEEKAGEGDQNND